MATVTYYVAGQNNPPAGSVSATSFLKGMSTHGSNVIDLSLRSNVAADVIQCVNIPAGVIVTRVSVLVLTAAGATCTCAVGDGDTPNGWDASVDLNAAAGTITRSLEATDTFGIGKRYASADTIDITLNNTNAVGKFEVIVEWVVY